MANTGDIFIRQDKTLGGEPHGISFYIFKREETDLDGIAPVTQAIGTWIKIENNKVWNVWNNHATYLHFYDRKATESEIEMMNQILKDSGYMIDKNYNAIDRYKEQCDQD